MKLFYLLTLAAVFPPTHDIKATPQAFNITIVNNNQINPQHQSGSEQFVAYNNSLCTVCKKPVTYVLAVDGEIIMARCAEHIKQNS